METEFRSSVVCRPLISAVSPDLYQVNAFRITGLPVDASPRDISKHAGKIKMMLELGHSSIATGGAMPLQPPPTLDQIRSAVEMLKDPETRLVQELFWFWPIEFGSSRTDPAFHAWAAGNGEAALRIWTLKENDPQVGPVARHNLAVFWHLAAMDGERAAISPMDPTLAATLDEYWRMSIKRWTALVDDDAFWDRVAMRIRQFDDPRLTAPFARSLRAGLVDALGKIHVDLALRHAGNGNAGFLDMHAQLLRELIGAPARRSSSFEHAVVPLRNRLEEKTRSARKACEEQPGSADDTANKLIQEAKPLLEILDLIADDQACADLFDAVALVCVQCASVPRPSTDAPGVISLLEHARNIAIAPALIQHIDSGLALWKARERLLPISEQLDRVCASDLSPKSKVWRIRDHVLAQLATLINSDPYNPAAYESRSAAANALRKIAFEAADSQDDWETAFGALDLAAQHACHEDLGRQIWADRSLIENKRKARQEWVRLEARREAIARLVEKLDAIEAEPASPRTLAFRIEQEILPYIAMQIPGDQRREANDCVASSLRRIAASAWNDFQSTSAALHALTVACSLVGDPELRTQLIAEKDRAEHRYRLQEQQNLLLRIRDAEIEINGLGVRAGDVFLPVDEIFGVRWGARSVNGELVSWSEFQVEIAASCSRRVCLDCYRLLRGKAQIKEDFDKLTEALRIHIVPQLVGAIVCKLKAGGAYVFCETDPGLDASAALGVLDRDSLILRQGQWDHSIGLASLAVQAADGSVVIRDLRQQAPVATWSLGQVWNAPLLPEIIARLGRQS